MIVSAFMVGHYSVPVRFVADGIVSRLANRGKLLCPLLDIPQRGMMLF
jgi:hypothetical protein